jgi:hypothetical protein
MTVKELIHTLQNFPEDMQVLTNGYEDDFEHILSPRVIEVVHKPGNPYYLGEFAECFDQGSGQEKAVLIARNTRPDNL